MDFGYSSGPVNQKRGGKGVQATVELANLLIPQSYPVIHFVLFQVRLHRCPAIFVHGNAQDREPLILISLLELHEPRDFNFAGTAPGGPEIQQDHFAFVVRKLDAGTAGIFEREIGCYFPFVRGFDCCLD